MTTATKAPVPAKPTKNRLKAALETAPSYTADNMSEVKLKDLNFKVPPELHFAIKQTALVHGVTMRELLEQMFKEWSERHNKGG